MKSAYKTIKRMQIMVDYLHIIRYNYMQIGAINDEKVRLFIS